MICEELLQESTESFLKSLISEVSESLIPDFDSFTPFGELGIDSFLVLKIVRRLEADFGNLPKTLLFEYFNVRDLALYFVNKHYLTLSTKFGAMSQETVNGDSPASTESQHRAPVASRPPAEPAGANGHNAAVLEDTAVRMLETRACEDPTFAKLVESLFDRYKTEGCVSRGTRKIAPNLFIGSARRGYFNYGRCRNILLVYGYAGPRDYFPVLVDEIHQYCGLNKFQLNILADEEMQAINGISFSATPFGVMQRIRNLKDFTLEGGAMRRLRYQVSKFQKSGACKTEEYQCGSNADTDGKIAGIIERWCGARTMVNPLVHDVRAEILAGALPSQHRLFLTSLDGILQNVIMITAMCAEQNGYLMDLEFYPPEMPMGGLEFAIVSIIGSLVAEGCDLLSLGGTYGCKLNDAANADPEIDRILDDLRAQNVFNDSGNLQFKNKFRPENRPIFLCRSSTVSDPGNVIDVIMMIADPDKLQTSDENNHNAGKARAGAALPVEKPSPHGAPSLEALQAASGHPLPPQQDRFLALSEFRFNPLNIPDELVEFDLKTDSWAQLRLASIEAQMRHLQAQIQHPVSLDESVRSAFPLPHFVLTESGQAAERIFFKAWSKKGVVLQNLLFPSTIFHQIDNGFTNKELPGHAVFDLESQERYKGNMDWEALRAEVSRAPSTLAFVCIEVNNNAAGGQPVSMQHLRDVKELLGRYSVPLVIDATRVVENARFLVEHEKEFAGKTIWAVVREILSYADVIIGSLTKDFGVTKGGIIATRDPSLLDRLQELVSEEDAGLDLIDRKLIALSLHDRQQIEAAVVCRMDGVQRIWRALSEHRVPIAEPAGGHCVLIDVKRISEFKDFEYPVPSFLAWLYLNTGIRASAHSVGMQKHTNLNQLVRLAIPLGLKPDQIDTIKERLIDAFTTKINIPEVVMESSAWRPMGVVYANYRLLQYHKSCASSPTGKKGEAQHAYASGRSPVPLPGVQGASPHRAVATGKVVEENGADARNGASHRTLEIAVVGMAGRYPKAKNLTELWENLAQGRDCIEEIPEDRLAKRRQHGRMERYRGGFIDGVDKFDSLFFNISPREAEMLDPQERLFLEVAWETLEDAGYYPESLVREDEPRNIGVFVGAVWAMYQMLGVEQVDDGEKVAPNSFLWSIANRVSYCFNLSGPSLTVDTACSSSLAAIYLACEAIRAGECPAAIVGGVNLDLHRAKLDINQAGGALSVDGVCRSFGKGANGYVAGEGVGALLLKPLHQAEKDRDNIYGVIKSAVVNHGGRTTGYTVPNPKAQARLIASAIEKAGVGARSIGYVEAHGTGTELGDPIEIAALTDAFSTDQVGNKTCAIGSIKTNIGHLEAAAGIVSVSKVLLQMKHRKLVPSLHSSELNSFIDFERSPFYVIQTVEDWKAKEVDGLQQPLRAGVSSFGAGGLNAHIILESYTPIDRPKEEAAQPKELSFPLSARTQEALREAAVRLARYVEQDKLDLADVSYTLQVGRKAFDHRVTIIAGTKEELLEKLVLFLAGKQSEDIATGHIKGGDNITRLLNRREKEEFVRLLLQRRDARKLAELWVTGLLDGWPELHSQGLQKKISLPTYPFADKRHWAGKRFPMVQSLPSAAVIHPMVDTNESTFERQLFQKTFSERDFFIHDHLVADVPTLPGVAYLELARKAGELAAGRKVQKIRNVVWVSAIAVRNSTPKTVFIELKPSGAIVRFEVFSRDEKGNTVPHCQGTLLYATKQEATREPEYVNLESLRARCAKVIDGKNAYTLFKSFGLNLGASFQVLGEIYKNQTEALGVLELPEFRREDLGCMVLQPSLLDGSLQAGMAAQLGENVEEMFVPFSIGEVEILHPLAAKCLSYVTRSDEGKEGRGGKSRTLKSNVLILDESGKVLIKISESIGVPLRELDKKPAEKNTLENFAKLYYSYEWGEPSLRQGKKAEDLPASMLLFATDETMRDLYQHRLSAAGKASDQVVWVQPGDTFADLGGRSYTVNPQKKDDFKKLLASLVGRQASIENICFAWPVVPIQLAAEASIDELLANGVYSFLFLCQCVIDQKLESTVRILYLYSAKPGEIQPANEAVTGFVHTLHLEHPKLFCKTVEVRQQSLVYDQILDAICGELLATEDTRVVRYQESVRYTKTLKAFDLNEPGGVPPAQEQGLKPNGVYLITGGSGALGLIFAEYLAREYKARLVLTARSELSVEQNAKLDEFRALGSEVLYVAADVGSYKDVAHLVKETRSRFGTIHGVIHAAGVLRDSLIRNKTAEEMRAVFAPKVHGTTYLDELTRNDQLDFFVTFSSLAAVTGNAGQCDYSFANSFMDSFAAKRDLLRAAGLRSGKSVSFNWSLWADGGMRLDEQTELFFKNTLGIRALTTETGRAAFVKGLTSPRSHFAVLEGLQDKVEIAWGLRKKLPVASPASSEQSGSAPGDRADDLRAWLQDELSQTVMKLLKLDAGDVLPDSILLDLGFDSIGLTTFANAINEKFQLDITPVLFFDYPSLAEIARYLAGERESEIRRFYTDPAASASDSTPPVIQRYPAAESAELGTVGRLNKGWDLTALDRPLAPLASHEKFSPALRFVNMPIAIVGISGVMPQSEDLGEFWENLKNSKDMITVIPPDRWRWQDYYGDPLKEINKSNSKWGGFMDEIDKFDPLFFGISPREAQAMDPQQRIFLQTVWKAIEDSGQKVSDLSGTKTGLFVGVATNDYVDVMNGLEVALDGYSASGNSHSVLANRVSFLLNLRGPSAPIDTACSSSLVALHRAIESIHTGSCEMAIVGGVQVMLSPAAYISFGMAGMLSGDGKCKAFDKRANGYVRGEGCGAMFLKSLSAAEADGNHIYAVIRATAENHGGRVTTLTAPNSAAQTSLLIEAYEKAQIDPATVGYIECHGTGTSLGDPIEIQALSKAFSELYKRRKGTPPETPHCGLSSVKTNIGHLETAAGIASMLKVLLAIKHRQIPANLHFEEINPYINLKGTPFYIADKLTRWEAPKAEDGTTIPRRAGVSSFGFGGANAHIVLEEYIPPARPSAAGAREPQLIVLSAKTADRLAVYIQSIRTYLDKEEPELADLAYTLQVGRDEMPERMALVASSMEDLKEKLQEIANSGYAAVSCYRNTGRKADENPQRSNDTKREGVIPSLIEKRDLNQLGALWVAGTKIDWHLLHTPRARQRISIPTYPFAKERYWIPSTQGKRTSDHGRMTLPYLHPLIHRNISTLEQQKFASRFSGDEFYFTDHIVETQKVLPGVAYLEMARAAGELSGNAKVRAIRNLTWERPLVVEGGQEVEVLLTTVKNEVRFSVESAGREGPVTHCTGKIAYRKGTSTPELVDVAGVRTRCPKQVISGKELYLFLNKSGLKLGKGFQIVQGIYANEFESLAILHLPEHLEAEARQYWLHPALMDGSLHTAIGLMMKNSVEMPLSLPYSVGEVEIYHELTDLCYGYATWATDTHPGKQINLKANFDLLDKNGKVLVRIKDFVSRPLPRIATAAVPREALEQCEGTPGEHRTTSLQLLTPVWNRRPLDSDKRIAPAGDTRVLLLGADQPQLEWLRSCYPKSQILQTDFDASIETIAKKLADCSFDQLFWMAPGVAYSVGGLDESNEQIIDQQERGVFALFRIVKALLLSGNAEKRLEWTIVTNMTQRVMKNESIRPAHAGIAGLVGSMAKEYPQWDLRLLDIDSMGSVSARECLSLPWDKQGNCLASRCGEWFQHGLALATTPPPAEPAYRQHGVYVVIGGAGGVGEVWSRFVIEKFQANVVWIGRREYNPAIEDKINALSLLGPAPLYISADATNLGALEEAAKAILSTYPSIHGVVHSALVLHDQSLARMEDAAFRASVRAKADIAVNLDTVFGGQALDFMLFFSSIVSFVRSPGQSNYSAGCTFQDSFAQKLQRERSYPVKIMNWGYWGSVGIVANEAYNELMKLMGIGSIEPQEGMAALETLLSSELSQLGLIKTLNSEATAGLNLSETLSCYPKIAPTILPQVQAALSTHSSDEFVAGLQSELPTPEMNELVTEILASSLMDLGLFDRPTKKVPGLTLDSRPVPYFERWLNTSIHYLQEQKWLSEDEGLSRTVRSLGDLWAEWEGKEQLWRANPNLQPQSALLEACLRALPGILSGKQQATDVMFPNSSMHLVEGIYRDNALAEHFNDVLAKTLTLSIEHQLRAGRNREIRILEIGAGTGGTTLKLLPLLQSFPIAEYCYTDVSKAFLMHAEKHYRPLFPILTTSILDISKPLARQSITPGHYDFVIAANVLHATPDIRQTLRNAKAALVNQGILLLNEISAWSLFSHLTFGLLEGWWLHQDTAVRLPGSPGLAPHRWRAVLLEEGFESILFPAEKAHTLGQQIIAAGSNGWVRQPITKTTGFGDRGSTAIKTNRAVNDRRYPLNLAEQAGNAHIERVVTEKLSEALRMDLTKIRDDVPFADYGVDSIIGVKFMRTISEAFEIELETTKLFEYSTVKQLSQYIWTNWQQQISEQLARIQGISPVADHLMDETQTEREAGLELRLLNRVPVNEVGSWSNAAQAATDDTRLEPIAIIGMSGRFAESECLDEFWQNIKHGKELVKEVTRWSAKDCVASETNRHGTCSHGSFVESIDRFDPAFFGISTEEATYMDPQQRLFLEECWSALEHAGYAGKSVQEKRCGVYVGCGSSNYSSLFQAEPPPQAFWGNSESVIPARIAYCLNLQGPAIAINTACSSSLVSIHLACQGLWSKETEMALAGGVFLQATPGFYQVANRASMLSPEGKCYSFDARANGFVPGEGVGVVVLKRLGDALQDGDCVHAVIAGSGINQDGSSNGLIAPNARAQEQLERSVYERFHIDPQTIQVLEAHGTGTLLGDSIEYGAINRSFREYTEKRQFCALGTVKTNIGHAATAAGVAGVLKLVLSLKHRQIPPSLHFQKANPAIDFESGPFYVNTQLKDWNAEENAVRRAAISSFGFSGTNAHLVLEEASPVRKTNVESPSYLIALSARSSEQLKQQVANLLAFLRHTPHLSMNDLSATLILGRMHFAHRFSCLARSQEELIQLLTQWVEAGTAAQIYTANLQEGRVREHISLKRFGDHCIQECRQATTAASYLENLATIADLYVQGYSLDFNQLFSRGSSRIPLPSYPFAKERYWIEPAPAAKPVLPGAVAQRLHPLIHINTSTISQHSYRSTVTGTEFFLQDHQAATNGHRGEKQFPEAAYLEMARAAIERAAPIVGKTQILELENTVWGDPMVVVENREVTIAVIPNESDRIDYEIYSGNSGQEMIHCQGRVHICDRPAAGPLHISQLQGQMHLRLDRSSVYADFAKMGLYYGPAHQSIVTVHQGVGQLLARLAVPQVIARDEAVSDWSAYWLHPTLVAGALQAGIRLVADDYPGSLWLPNALETLRVISPCTAEMLAWVRCSPLIKQADASTPLDIDLTDTEGSICVEMRGLSYRRKIPSMQFVIENPANGLAAQSGPFGANAARSSWMGAEEQIESFLRRETALQLQRPPEEVPTGRSFLDLGLTSLGLTALIQQINKLLPIGLLPSVLFEHRDIQSLAAYLAATYPAMVDALPAIPSQEEQTHPAQEWRTTPTRLTPLPRKKPLSGWAAAPSHAQTDVLLQKVEWDGRSFDDSYEKMTF